MTTRKKVFLHIGAPKTGTTYVQRVLWQNKARLMNRGFNYPVTDINQHIDVSRDFRFEPAWWDEDETAPWAGLWLRTCARIAGSPTPVAVLSEELLAGAAIDHIELRLSELRRMVPGVDIHVIYTARDIARQIPSDWQEQMKHGHMVTLEEFTDDLVEHGIHAPDPFGYMFWGHHDPNFVLPKWEAAVGKSNIHVITIPEQGPSLLWERFCHVIGLDPDNLNMSVPDSNGSIGLVEAEVLRRLNEHHRIEDRLGARYDSRIRLEFAQSLLGAWNDTERPVLPVKHFDWAQDRARQMVSELADRGYQITGDLNDLIPTIRREGRVCGDLTDTDLRAISMRALADLLVH